jgi:hypothetical protein
VRYEWMMGAMHQAVFADHGRVANFLLNKTHFEHIRCDGGSMPNTETRHRALLHL